MGRAKAMRTLAAAAAGILLVALPANAQNWGRSGGKPSGPLIENRPKVDEKAYKAALDRIPVPDQKYDPWGITRPSEPAKTTRKSN